MTFDMKKPAADAIQKSVEEGVERQQSLRAQLEEILRRVDALPILDMRSADEILGYDEHGLPS